jgi:hypothetical protein
MECGKRIVCGPQDPLILLETAYNTDSNTKVRLGSNNPNKINPAIFLPFSTDGYKIYSEDQFLDPRDFFSSISKDNRTAIVLTAKEYYLLIELIEDFGREVLVLETEFPILKGIKYSSNLKKNLSQLNYNIKKIKTSGIQSRTLSSHFSRKHQYSVERTLRFKNKMDKYFFFADPAPYQEVFKLKECRANRKIIAFDFNSMFLDCMRGDFPSPKDIYYKSWNRTWLNEVLNPGLYHVVLQNPCDDFFNNFHPIRYKKAGDSVRFFMSNEHDVEVLLYHSELAEYRQYFKSIFIIDSVVSDRSVEHPLLKSALKVYKKRMSYRHTGNYFYEKMAKYEIQLMHSSTSIRQKMTLVFNSAEEALSDLRSRYWLSFSDDLEHNEYRISQFVKNTGAVFFRKGKKRFIKTDNIESRINVFSLSRNVVANSRTKMVRTIKKIAEFPSAEICYTNVDSIHVSISESKYEDFMGAMSEFLGDEPGKLKIEAIADEGYWFDVGRYWLIKDGLVVAFKNSTLNRKNSSTLFEKKRTFKFIVRTPYFSSIKRRIISINSLFSYKKKVRSSDINDNNIDFLRFNSKEIMNATAFGNLAEEERYKSHDLKKQLYNSISTHYDL